MTKQQLYNKLKDTRLTAHERELLLQQLHYMQVEGIEQTVSRKRKPRNDKAK